MASTILYKFRSGTTFEALPLPGTAARLFDVKKAIVQAKKLDSTGMLEFDLSVRNANTNEEYVDESMLLPRGTRLVVQRLPAPRGHGFLARMARNEHGGGGVMASTAASSAPSGFYTVSRQEEEEYIPSGGGNDEEKELAALRAVTETANVATAGGLRPSTAATGFHSSAQPAHRVPGGPPPPQQARKPNFRPNADPELREHEQKLQPKKRATGIPRTFLNLSAPPQTEKEEESTTALLQPNTLGFQELVNRGGGRLDSSAKDLEYALKLTATTIPEYLQCGICHTVVKNAMLLPWDSEGRTACETCIRDALTQNGFRCPLTGLEGVSPDDLHPNHGLRKAADKFIKEIMEKMEEIEKQQVEDETTSAMDTNQNSTGDILEGDTAEKGVIVSRGAALSKRKKPEEDDPFGDGDDDFGGDVFAVEAPPEEQPDEKEEKEEPPKAPVTKEKEPQEPAPAAVNDDKTKDTASVDEKTRGNKNENNNGDDAPAVEKHSTNNNNNSNNSNADTSHGRRERRRGPPVGYVMGPAGGASVSASGGGNDSAQSPSSEAGGPSSYQGSRGGRGARSYSPTSRGGYNSYEDRGGGYRGRGRGGRSGRYGGRYSQSRDWDSSRSGGYNQGGYDHRSPREDDASDTRGQKRSREDSFDSDQQDRSWEQSDRYGDDRYAGTDYSQGGSRDYGGSRGTRDYRYDSRGRGTRGAPYRGGGGGRWSGGRSGGYRGGGRGYGRGRY